jgi:hypothetical protein
MEKLSKAHQSAVELLLRSTVEKQCHIKARALRAAAQGPNLMFLLIF